jgi:D-3-phosphoglycerate dehydrogenase
MKIQVLNNISSVGLDILEENKFDICGEGEEGFSGIILRSKNIFEVDYGRGLFAISRAGAGTNNINVQNCSEKGIVVFNTPGANANAVKEMVICALILGKRDLVTGNKTLDSIAIDDLSDDEVSVEIESMKKQFVGQEVNDKKLCVLGLGAIGSLVASQAMSLGMRVQGYDPGLTVDIALSLPSNLIRCNSIEEALKDADYVSLHIPLNNQTKGMINKKIFNSFKKDCVLVNFSRGGIVFEEDLIDALEKEQIYKYITDFPSKKLLQRLKSKKDIVIFPHLGASTKESEENCAKMACAQISNFLKLGKIENSVNFPNINSDTVAKHRIFITNKNHPGVISQIAETLANEKINILEFVNKSREGFACNIIDSDEKFDEQTISELLNINGVTNARVCY